MIERNRQIMDWMRAPMPEPSDMACWSYPADLDACVRICREWDLSALAKRIEARSVAFGCDAPDAWRVVLDACECRDALADAQESMQEDDEPQGGVQAGLF